MKFLSSFTAVVLLVFSISGCDMNADGKIKVPWKESQKKQLEEPIKLTNEDLNRLNQAFVGLSRKLSPSVVNIYTTTSVKIQSRGWGNSDPFFDFFFGNPFNSRPQTMERSALGSGFIINSKKGYVLTNSHVVQPEGKTAEKIRVKLMGHENEEGYEAELMGADSSADVALLKVSNLPEEVSESVLGNSAEVQVGEWVLAIGNPYGHTNTVTQGIVSALGRESDINRAEFIQTSASINPGNSGGPLFNIKGEVIGINTAMDARAQGIGFAVPINVAKNVVSQLLEYGEIKQGWLGVHISDLDSKTAKALGIEKTKGVLVQEVEVETPAEKAGLKPYDVILQVNQRKVESGRELSAVIAGYTPGEKVRLLIIREKRKKQLKLSWQKEKKKHSRQKKLKKAVAWFWKT